MVKHASDPASVLHSAFTWDDTKAAHLYRLVEARQLIQNLVVEIQQDPPKNIAVEIRAFHSVTDRTGRRGYFPIQTILGSKVQREQLLEQARMELRRWEATYSHLQELAAVVRIIRDTLG